MFLATVLPLSATHIVGGEIYYEYLGGNDYLITLKIYRDCGPANTNQTGFDDNAAVGFFVNGNLDFSINIPTNFTLVNQLPLELENPCFIIPPELCVEEAVYESVVNLPPSPNGYEVVYQRCCRNPSINNLTNPQDLGITLRTEIPGTSQIGMDFNSSPVFQEFPPVALCTNGAFIFDHSAVDQDGDSLAYEFCAPLHGGGPDTDAMIIPDPPFPPPYNQVTYAPGFDALEPIPSNPQFEIDPATGEITGTPTQQGQYAIGICVKEYRDGELISTVRRDFQFNVTVCDPNVSAAIEEQTTEEFCQGLTIDFTSNSVNATSFIWDFGDPNSDNDFSTEPNPSWTYNEVGEYEVWLIVNEGWSCEDSTSTIYEVYPEVVPTIVEGEFECLNGQETFSFDSDGNFSEDVTYSWSVNGTDMGTDSVLTSTPLNPGEQNTILLTIEDYACTLTDEILIDLPPTPQAQIGPQTEFCNGLTYDFVNESQDAESYSWDVDIEGSWDGGSNSFEPTFTYPDTGHYQVQLTAFAPQTCPTEDIVEIEVYTLLNPSFPVEPSQCFNGHDFDFEALGAESSEAQYTWDFSSFANPETSTEQNPQNVTFSEAGVFAVHLNIAENGCERDYLDSVEVIYNPIPDFTLHHNSGCPPFMVTFTDSSEHSTPINYFWEFGDGSTSNSSNPVHVYQNPGIYDVTLTINSNQGCVDEVSYSIPDAVEVLSAPDAGFIVDPQTMQAIDPVAQIIDESEGAVSCFYYFEDGSSSNSCDFLHTFTETGYVDVMQVVTNEFGCTDTAYYPVEISGHIFYAPNAFTPDGDGMNDVFVPKSVGVGEYTMYVYNRWGRIIFKSIHPKVGWDGTFLGEPVPQGIYTYQVFLEDLRQLPHEYTGHINLIR
jgi:gliding motility-associated-like protein